MQKHKFFYIFPIIALLLTAGLGCKGTPKDVEAAAQPITLEYWSVSHDSRTMRELIDRYKTVRSYVTIRYRRFRPEEFERELLEALAEDRGPDLITIHNTWVGKYQNKLLPAPPSLKVANVYIKGGRLTKERVVEIQNIPTPTPQQIDRTFVKTVKNDVLRADSTTGQQRLWGLPMALDTMVLYYNQDLLDQVGIPQAPSTWTELQEAIVATTRYDSDGNILQAGGALGTGSNVDRSADLITTLMMQNGATMSNSRGRSLFHLIPDGMQGVSEPPGIESLRFYTDFANPTKQTYTWNGQMEDSLDAFARGKSAFFFGYAYHIPQIKARAPKLNYRILQMPQLNPNNPKNIANYWIESVSKKAKHPNEAWDFVMFLTRAEQADLYTSKSLKPTALRGSINKQLENPDLAPFATQVLTAESWYRGKNPIVADNALVEMIDYIHTNRALETNEDIFLQAIERAASKIDQSL